MYAAAAIHVCAEVKTAALLRLSGFQRNLNSSAATLLLSLEVDLPPGVWVWEGIACRTKV